jgi:drug/metabolite transporter (DMT)-like permease
MTLMYFSLILINTLILVSGQFLWKFGMQNQTISLSFVSIVKVLFSPYVFSGLAMYGFATVIWLYILSKVPLSLAYPIQSITYIFAVFGAYFIFNETLTIYKVLGCLLIMLGVTLIGLSPNKAL